MSTTQSIPTPHSLKVREHNGAAFYEAAFRVKGKQYKRRLGRARIERDPADPPELPGGWRKRRGACRLAPR